MNQPATGHELVLPNLLQEPLHRAGVLSQQSEHGRFLDNRLISVFKKHVFLEFQNFSRIAAKLFSIGEVHWLTPNIYVLVQHRVIIRSARWHGSIFFKEIIILPSFYLPAQGGKFKMPPKGNIFPSKPLKMGKLLPPKNVILDRIPKILNIATLPLLCYEYVRSSEYTPMAVCAVNPNRGKISRKKSV